MMGPTVPYGVSPFKMDLFGIKILCTTSYRGLMNSTVAVVCVAMRNFRFTVGDCNEGLLCKC